MYDHAKDMRRNSRYAKPVAILLDEFDRLFDYGPGTQQAYDGPRMTGVFQEMMDGIVGYEGVFLIGLTNVPKQVPPAILRRFKYVDVVGQLTTEERSKLLKQFLSKGLPLTDDICEADYTRWAEMLRDAPGDVLGKVADEVHFKFMKGLVDDDHKHVAIIEKTLAQRLRKREVNDKDRAYLKQALGKHSKVDAIAITTALDSVLKQPQIQMQIEAARDVYRDAEAILKGLSKPGASSLGFGAQRKQELW
jgi:AAA+ superfamily predicted ATPase